MTPGKLSKKDERLLTRVAVEHDCDAFWELYLKLYIKPNPTLLRKFGEILPTLPEIPLKLHVLGLLFERAADQTALDEVVRLLHTTDDEALAMQAIYTMAGLPGADPTVELALARAAATHDERSVQQLAEVTLQQRVGVAPARERIDAARSWQHPGKRRARAKPETLIAGDAIVSTLSTALDEERVTPELLRLVAKSCAVHDPALLELVAPMLVDKPIEHRRLFLEEATRYARVHLSLTYGDDQLVWGGLAWQLKLPEASDLACISRAAAAVGSLNSKMDHCGEDAADWEAIEGHARTVRRAARGLPAELLEAHPILKTWASSASASLSMDWDRLEDLANALQSRRTPRKR